MKTLYRFKSNAALEDFMFNTGHIGHNEDMGQILSAAGTFSLVQKNPGSGGYYAFKNGVKLKTKKEDVYVTKGEMLKFFEEVKPEETELGRFDKAVETVSSVVDIDSRTADTDESVDELREGLNFLQGLSKAIGIQFTTAQSINALDYVIKNR